MGPKGSVQNMQRVPCSGVLSRGQKGGGGSGAWRRNVLRVSVGLGPLGGGSGPSQP